MRQPWGASTGMPNREAMAKAYNAVLSFVEDQNAGLGAKEIIGYGFSIGGGVQGEALKTHPLRQDVSYVFVKDRTFSSIAKVIPVLGPLIKLFGWNISPTDSSRALQAPEIIISRANIVAAQILRPATAAFHDGIISAEASLTTALRQESPSGGFPSQKVFIGIPSEHNLSMTSEDCNFLSERIREQLTPANQNKQLFFK